MRAKQLLSSLGELIPTAHEFVLTISMNSLFTSKLSINHKITEQSMFNSVGRDFLRWVMKKNWTISGQWDFEDIKMLNYNDLTNDIRTENPRVGGSIPSRPTTPNCLKLGFIICKF